MVFSGKTCLDENYRSEKFTANDHCIPHTWDTSMKIKVEEAQPNRTQLLPLSRTPTNVSTSPIGRNNPTPPKSDILSSVPAYSTLWVCGYRVITRIGLYKERWQKWMFWKPWPCQYFYTRASWMRFDRRSTATGTDLGGIDLTGFGGLTGFGIASSSCILPVTIWNNHKIAIW